MIRNIYIYILKSSMDRIFSLRKAVKGQAIIEYVVFIAMFSLAIIAFSNGDFFQRLIQGRWRSSIGAFSGSVEQYRTDEAPPVYSIDRIDETIRVENAHIVDL